jgi:hypothetical protein
MHWTGEHHGDAKPGKSRHNGAKARRISDQRAADECRATVHAHFQRSFW